VTFDEHVFPAKESIELSTPLMQPLAIDWPTTVNFPLSEPKGMSPMLPLQTPSNTTVYATPPLCPPPSSLTPINALSLPGLPQHRLPLDPSELCPAATSLNCLPSPRHL
jgi:hypothetical protein